MRPRVADIVHYVAYGTPGGEYLPEHRAAIITATHMVPGREIENLLSDEIVSIVVLNPTGMFFNERVRRDDTGQIGGTWHWPERDPAQN